MNSFDDRKKGQEAKYAHDQEFEFKAVARRNKLLGLWAAAEMGLEGADAEAYSKQVGIADFEEPGDEDVYRKVAGDFEEKGIDMSEHRIRRQMEDLLANIPDEKEKYRQIKKINFMITKLNMMGRKSPLLEEKELYYKELVDKFGAKE